MRWFRALLPREDKFFDLFEAHARTIVEAAEELRSMLTGQDVEKHCQRIVVLEDQADKITADVLLAVRKSFITPFDRGDIKDLVHSMDDAIDMMHKTVKTVRLFEQTSFDPLMQQMGDIIVDAAKLTAEAVPLLEKAGANANRLSTLAEQITRLEDVADEISGIVIEHV